MAAISGATITISIGTTKTKMHINIVLSNIRLLLSKELMKQANMKLNFENDTITAFGQPINLIATKSGHYPIPITNNKRALNDLKQLTSTSPSILQTTNQIKI